jgi:uncharacterized protein YcbX
MRQLARINVTPVKGTSLTHPGSAAVSEAGVAQDRPFFLVDERGALHSGSKFGPLVRIRSAFDPVEEHLALRFPDGTLVEGRGDDLGGAETTDFYGRGVAAHAVVGPFSAALTRYCGAPVRLMRCDEGARATDVEPLTLVSTASVHDLARRGGRTDDLDSRRFRITLELHGCSPYEEDTWHGREVRVGEVTIRVGEQIPRCLVTTQDPDTGVKDWNTLTQIARQRDRIPGGGLPFGVYARVVSPGTIRVGDAIDLDF